MPFGMADAVTSYVPTVSKKIGRALSIKYGESPTSFL